MQRWIRRTFALLFAVLITVAGAALPASAGGPTSVLLSAPPKVVAFGYDDGRYELLRKLVDMDVSAPGAGDPGDHASGQFVRALWLIHDMSTWRFDLIYPNATGGPWIASYLSADGTPNLPAKPVWHRSGDPAALTRLLASVNLLSGQSYGGPVGPPTMAQLATEPQPTAAPQPAPVTQTIESHDGALSGWRWMIPGIALGAAASYLALRYLPRRRPWELTDVE
jgi:hypothetical protein